MRLGDDPVTKCDLSSLRLLGSVGEPINPSLGVVSRVVGRTAAPSSTPGGRPRPAHLITRCRRHGAEARLRHPAVLRVVPAIVDASTGTCSRASARRAGDHPPGGADADGVRRPQAFQGHLFHPVPGNYFTATARAATRRLLLITGRIDDVLNVSGHRIGTPRSSRRWCCTTRWRRPPSSATARHQGPGIYAYVSPWQASSRATS